MPQVTIKQLGEAIRKDLKTAQTIGRLPRELRFTVRATKGRGRPNVNVTIDGVGSLIPEPRADNVDAWMAASGQDLQASVEHIRNRYNPPEPVYGGETKFGPIFLSATIIGTTTIES
jgi:hypothetical protein